MTPRDHDRLADAGRLLGHGRHDDALALVRRVLHNHPDHAEARMLEARIEVARSRPQAALASLDAMELHDQSRRGRPDTAMVRLQALYDAGETSLALRLAERLGGEFPDDPRPHRFAAVLALQLSEPQRAARAWRDVVRLNPSDRDARRELAALLEADRPDEAIALLERDADPTCRRRVAKLLARVGRYRDAWDLYRQLMLSEPGDRSLALEAGRLADAMGRDAEAVTRLGDVGDLVELALAHMHAGRLATAGRAWWHAIRSGNDSTRAWMGLLICAIETGHDAVADRAKHHLDANASKQDYQRMMAAIWPHAACGLAVTQAMTGSPDMDAAALSPLQTLLRQAQAALKGHVRRFPRRADTHYHLAICHEATGNTDGAEHSVNEALRLNPRYSAASRLSLRLARHKAAA